jgi:S-DNA-T family DNA segregation ATPase FtsK/SpoIIIE
MIGEKVGPTVVQYRLKPAEGVKLNRIENLKKDLSLALKAKSIRIQAPIP